MRFLGWNLLFSAWLLISAFIFPQTPSSAVLTALTAFLVLLFAVLAAARPAARFVNTALGALLGVSALLLPGLSTAAAVNAAIVGALVFALSLVRPTHAAPSEPARHEEAAAQPAKP